MKHFKRLARARSTAQFILITLPVIAMGQAPVNDVPMTDEWHDVQVRLKRVDRADWWRRLELDQLDTFINAGADVNVSDKRGWTPLHSAARYSANPGIVSALVTAGAAVGAKNRSGDTPLHWAAAENANVEVVRALIRAGAAINERDKFGWLPIHTAAESNPNPEVIEALLAAGSKKKKRAYFILFRPAFLLKHNAQMSKADKERALTMLRSTDEEESAGNNHN